MAEMLSIDQLNGIAHEFGTPTYVYHAEKIKEQYDRLKSGFSALPVHFFYAAKALTNISVLKYMHALGIGIDCSSLNEVRLAQLAGFPKEKILYTSNGISFEEIVEAASLGAHINIDSLSNLKKFGEKFGSSVPVGIRLRPNILAGANLKISTGHKNSKFGIPVDQIAEIRNVIDTYHMHLDGLHIHTGSGISDPDVFVQGLKVLFDLLPMLPPLRFIDLGGGFKVPFRERDSQIDISELAEKLHAAFKQYFGSDGNIPELWFEPGKFLVSESGYFITTVNVMKHTPETEFVSLNSGFNHLIRPMFYDAYHRIWNISNPLGLQRKYSVVGNICETDTFAWDRKLPEVREGDHLVFLNAGAYGFEMSSNFNSRFKPAEVFFKDGRSILIRRRQQFEDLLIGQTLL